MGTGVNSMSEINVKYPCRGCIYYNACGNTNRTVICKGRETRNGVRSNSKNNKTR